jgi:hypothetical protein
LEIPTLKYPLLEFPIETFGEVLNLQVSDLSGRKILIEDPKSGRDAEVAFMPEHIAGKLAEYVAGRQLLPAVTAVFTDYSM